MSVLASGHSTFWCNGLREPRPYSLAKDRREIKEIRVTEESVVGYNWYSGSPLRVRVPPIGLSSNQPKPRSSDSILFTDR